MFEIQLFSFLNLSFYVTPSDAETFLKSNANPEFVNILSTNSQIDILINKGLQK